MHAYKLIFFVQRNSPTKKKNYYNFVKENVSQSNNKVVFKVNLVFVCETKVDMF